MTLTATNTLHKRSVISIKDLSKPEMLDILDYSAQVKSGFTAPALQGKIIASCFFEPSTRTRLSFESAMLKNGGSVIGFADSANTSVSKRETLTDTMRVVSQYADAIIIRHPLEGAARHVSDIIDKPVINAGDGSNQHPTQTLTDLFSIRESQGKLEHIHIAFSGDLKYARTIHSLVQACALFNMRLYFVPTHGLGLADQAFDELKRQGVLFSIHNSLREVIPKIDVLYMTRVQEERLSKASTYHSENGYELSLSDLDFAKPNLKILHPLPRVREIEPLIDSTPHAYYFHQSQNGLYVRQALLNLILEEC